MKFYLELLYCQNPGCACTALATINDTDGGGTRITDGCGGPWKTAKKFVVNCDPKEFELAAKAFQKIVAEKKKKLR